MVIKEKVVQIGDEEILLRSAREEDAEQLMDYLAQTAKETRYLIREPEESIVTLEQERQFIREREEDARGFLLIASTQGKQIGSCSVSSLGSYSRYAHRCSIAIALYQAYCGRGIGRKMMEEALSKARELGYGQAELEVASSNKPAIHLYESLGFCKYGTFPNNMKYKDGTYEDACWMMKKLV